MPKIRVTAGDFSGTDAAQGFSDYDGPVPPKGVYECRTKLWKIVENSSGDLMFKIIFEINEPKGSEKYRYNGYAIWHNASITEKSAPYLNAMLDAIGIPRAHIWREGGRIVTDPKDDETVIKIGGKSPLGMAVKVNAKQKEYPKDSDQFSLNVVSFLATKKATGEDADDDDDDEVTEEPVGKHTAVTSKPEKDSKNGDGWPEEGDKKDDDEPNSDASDNDDDDEF
jgi:hypothetical protein